MAVQHGALTVLLAPAFPPRGLDVAPLTVERICGLRSGRLVTTKPGLFCLDAENVYVPLFRSGNVLANYASAEFDPHDR